MQQETVAKELDRIARELHDGFGADVLALFLRLRRKAEREKTQETQESAAEAKRILSEIRNIAAAIRR